MAKSRTKKKKKAQNTPKSQALKKISPSIKLERPESNSRIQLTIVPEFPLNDYRHQIPRLPEGSQGIYQITFVLAIPGKDVFKDKLDFVQIMGSGDSLLEVSSQVSFLKLSVFNDDLNAEILFLCNTNNRISGAQIRIHAPDFLTAEKVAFDLVMPQLSYWSFIYNISIDIAGYEIIEEETQSKKYNFGALGRIKQFSADSGVIKSTPEYRKFYAAYREGMNATNVFYQALSFYKVAEGILAERKREQRGKKIEPPIYANENIPNDIDDITIINNSLKILFKPYFGQSFEVVLDKFKVVIRHAIAHLSKLDMVLDADKFDDVNACLNAIPILHYIAHIMLKNDALNQPDIVKDPQPSLF